MQGWTAQVIALWYNIFSTEGWFQGVNSKENNRKEFYNNAIMQLTPF